MPRARVVSVLGLGFGDCGKGLFTDALARRLGAHTVVRFNGGAQAGHTVRLPDGRVHTFAQIGAAAFVPGVCTLLAHPVVVDPLALEVEARRLAAAGVPDALGRVEVDLRCRVLTPFHAALGRLRERARGAGAHGTTGLGIGEAVRESLERPDEVLRFGDLADRPRVIDKLEALRARGLAEARELRKAAEEGGTDLDILEGAGLPVRWWEAAAPLAGLGRRGDERLGSRLNLEGAVLFEGAQGLLLDEHHGFHPHTTWSSPHPREVEALLDASGGAEVRHFGVLRAYLTRHGPGPLPTEDAGLSRLPEPDNRDDGWQGRFRRGHPDGVLARYASHVAGGLDGLLLSHLDAMESGAALRWCEAYDLPGRTGVPARISRLETPPPGDLEARARITQELAAARPRYVPEVLRRPEALVERLEAAVGCRVRLGSWGPTHAHVKDLAGLES